MMVALWKACREFCLWGLTDPDEGLDPLVHGNLSPTERATWLRMKQSTKEVNERRIISVLKKLLVDYDSGEKVDSG